MTDNGSCHRSGAFAAALGEIKHVRTRPYRPQTNGKVERFNRTLAEEWAYAATYLSDEARAATYPSWLHYYNHHRPHTGIGGQRPSDLVHNLTGNLIVGAGSRAAVGTLVERASRFVTLVHLPHDHTAETVRDGLVRTVIQLPNTLPARRAAFQSFHTPYTSKLPSHRAHS